MAIRKPLVQVNGVLGELPSGDALGDYATKTGVETLANKTLPNPVLTGTSIVSGVVFGGSQMMLNNNCSVNTKRSNGAVCNAVYLDTNDEWRYGDQTINGGFHWSNAIGGYNCVSITSGGGLLVGTSTSGGWHGNSSLVSQTSTNTSAMSAWATQSGSNAIDARIEYTNSTYIQFWQGTAPVGAINPDGATGIVVNTTSDGSLKMNAVTLDPGTLFDQLEMWEGDWIFASGEKFRGPIAQDLHKLRPQAVTPGDDLLQPW